MRRHDPPPGLCAMGAMASGLRLYTECRACGHAGRPVAVAALIERFGPETRLAAAVARLRCSTCGALGPSFVLGAANAPTQP
jgi:hypothetical protein